MKARHLMIRNFRGVTSGTLLLGEQTLLAGPNGIGKSTICEALDLVLGPERSYRRPIVDEYDFTECNYQADDSGVRPIIVIQVVLTDLGEHAERRFGSHLRRWDDALSTFADEERTPADETAASPGGSQTNEESVGDQWCLPVIFLGRFDPDEDDFEGGTFFAHPAAGPDVLAPNDGVLGAGLTPFTREDKRQCGFIYLRASRTGTRALSFGKGSLLDTIARLESEDSGPLWEDAITRLRQVILTEPDSGFANVQTRLRTQVEQFLSLAIDPRAVDVRVTELTREHLREVLRLFVAAQPGVHGVPFNRLSTGTVNLLVFALLMYIAELKGEHTAIFAMEEPEIALPPHSQRRLIRFAAQHMSQTIVTSHSPYVIEEFDVDSLTVLDRDAAGILTGSPITLPSGFKLKRYRDNRRQFSEAVLARAVLVVEGSTEVAVMAALSDALEAFGSKDYTHVDLAGLTIFDAKSDTSVPLYAPVFKSLGKKVYGIHDKLSAPLNPDVLNMTTQFDIYVEHSYVGIERLLTEEIAPSALRRFLRTAAGRSDYPTTCGTIGKTSTDDEVKHMACEVLKLRKGDSYGYAALLISECRAESELPQTLRTFLIRVNTDLSPPTLDLSPEERSDDHDSSPDPPPEEPPDDDRA